MQVIRLENAEFEGSNSVYLLENRDETALIDTGIATPATERELRDRLADHGTALGELDDVVLTHWHPDHAGLAGMIQQESGATVHIHEADAPLVRGDEDAFTAMTQRQREQFEAWGMPTPQREQLLDRMEQGNSAAGEPVTVETLADGDSQTQSVDTVVVGGTRLEVIHAPGHTAGQCCFAFQMDGALQAFGGDALLPEYTPNVGGADVRVDRPLERYLETLRTIADREFEKVWPGHRDVITAPTDRANEIIDHHRERAERVCTVLAEHGPATAWEVSEQLFGDLAGIHVMHGPGEAYAHLDHLQHHGIVTETDGSYELRSNDPAVGDVI